MFWNKYPYTDFHELNLDMILKLMKELHAEWDEFTAVNKITNAGAWDITKQYRAWTVVSDNNVGYISLKPVPAGIAISNTEYWGVIADYDILITDLSNRISALENKTIMDYTGDGEVFPSDNPMGDQREYIVFRVPEAVNKFVDNVIGIQNQSHGPFGANPDVYGNAAIAFFDKNQVERGAIGYSRNSAIQPSGFDPDTVYIECGNPFGASGTDSDFEICVTNATNFEGTWFYPFKHESKTGKTYIKARGDKHVNVDGGMMFSNDHSSYAKLLLANTLTNNRIGLLYNIESGETGNKIDSTKNGYGITIGDAYDLSAYNLGRSYEGITFTKSVANTTEVKTLLNVNPTGMLYLGKFDYNGGAFNGMLNTSNNGAWQPAFCSHDGHSTEVNTILWNSGGAAAFINFEYGATIDASSTKGSIKYNSGSGQINYNTTSDYRVKTIKGNADNAVDIIKNIKVYNGYIRDAKDESIFCIAHELQSLYKPCVCGEKDAVDENGKPILQEVDYSKLIPIIIKALQEVINER